MFKKIRDVEENFKINSEQLLKIQDNNGKNKRTKNFFSGIYYFTRVFILVVNSNHTRTRPSKKNLKENWITP